MLHTFPHTQFCVKYSTVGGSVVEVIADDDSKSPFEMTVGGTCLHPSPARVVTSRVLLDDATYDGDEGYIRVHITHIDSNERTAAISSLHDGVDFPQIAFKDLFSLDDDPNFFLPLQLFENCRAGTALELTDDERQKKIIADASGYDRYKLTPSWIRNLQSQLAEFFLYRHSLTKESYFSSAKSAINADISGPLLEMLPGILEACQFFTTNIAQLPVVLIRSSVGEMTSLVFLCVPSAYFLDLKLARASLLSSETNAACLEAYRECLRHTEQFHLTSNNIKALENAIIEVDRCFPKCTRQLQETISLYLPKIKYLKDFRKRHIEKITPKVGYIKWLEKWTSETVNKIVYGYSPMHDLVKKYDMDIPLPLAFLPDSHNFYMQLFSAFQARMDSQITSGIKSPPHL